MDFLDKITNRKIYKLSFLFVIFLNTLNLAFFSIDLTMVYILLILWGGFIIVIDTFQKKLWYRGNHILYLCGFFVCLFFATITNTEFSSKNSILLVCMQGLIFLLMFMQKKGTSLLTIKNEMRSIQQLTCIVTFVASALSILMFLFNVSMTRNGVTIGLVGDRLFGVYFNCNPAAFLASMAIVFSIIALRNKYQFPIFYFVNIIIQATYILLTGTRSALLILLALLIALLYYTLFKRKEYSTIQKSFIIFGVSIVFFIAAAIIRNMLYVIPQLQGAVFEDSGRFQIDRLLEVISMIKNDPWGNKREIYNILNSLSSSRLELWTDAVKIWRISPFIGIGSGNFEIMGQTLIASGIFDGPTIVHTHNFLMESLVTSGVIGFTFFFAFTFRSFTALLETLRKYTRTKSYFMILMIGFIIFIEAMGGFLDYGVFYIYSMSSVLFWVYLGYLFWFNDHPRMKLINESMMYDFINYHLEDIQYHREPEFEECLVDLCIEEGKYFKEKDMYIIRLRINLHFDDYKRSSFIYAGLFKILKSHMDEDKIHLYEKEMALELYEIVKESMETFMSDASDTIVLPMIHMDAFENEK